MTFEVIILAMAQGKKEGRRRKLEFPRGLKNGRDMG
jgi:hypothetical protein